MTRSSVITLVILLLVVAIAFLFVVRVKNENVHEALEVSQAGTTLSEEAVYTDQNGQPVMLSQYLGQPIVAISWASWCPACAEQLKLLGEISSEYETTVALAFNRGEPINTATDFLEFHDIKTDIQLVMDPEDHFFNSIDGYSMPEIVVFGSNGDIVYHSRKGITREELAPVLEELQHEVEN